MQRTVIIGNNNDGLSALMLRTSLAERKSSRGMDDARSPLKHAWTSTIGTAWSVACEWESRRRSRRCLQSLGIREVDFCPDLAKVEREAKKPFWRA